MKKLLLLFSLSAAAPELDFTSNGLPEGLRAVHDAAVMRCVQQLSATCRYARPTGQNFPLEVLHLPERCFDNSPEVVHIGALKLNAGVAICGALDSFAAAPHVALDQRAYVVSCSLVVALSQL